MRRCIEVAGRGAFDSAGCVISAAKFHAAVRPADRLRLEYEVLPNASIRFSIHNDQRAVASGTLDHAR